MRMFSRPSKRRAAASGAAGLVLACLAAGTQAAVPAPAALVVERAWSRATPPGAPVAGGYLAIRNTGADDDRLLGGTSPDAARVELHEMSMDGGVMRMRALRDGLPLPAGATVRLAPGGIHLMLIAPAHPFAAGDKVRVTLRFEKAGPRDVVLDVLPLGATGPSG